ncbi:hypothetical protein JRQ81_005145, partial [Phrynocephalus forsythii]
KTESDLFVQVNEILVEAVGLEFPEIAKEIDQVYRVNSSYARKNKVSCELYVKCVRRAMRDMILRVVNNKPLKCQGKEILVLNQVLWKIRDVRKQYHFLTAKLNEKRINFSCLVLEGILVNWDSKKYRLDIIDIAKDFYNRHIERIEEQDTPEKREEE